MSGVAAALLAAWHVAPYLLAGAVGYALARAWWWRRAAAREPEKPKPQPETPWLVTSAAYEAAEREARRC